MLTDFLARARPAVDVLAAVCSGPMLLARAGLLAGRRVTVNRLCQDELRPLADEVLDARVVDGGDVVTSAALTSGIDLGLYLVERFAGVEAAEAATRQLEFPPSADVVRP